MCDPCFSSLARGSCALDVLDPSHKMPSTVGVSTTVQYEGPNVSC